MQCGRPGFSNQWNEGTGPAYGEMRSTLVLSEWGRWYCGREEETEVEHRVREVCLGPVSDVVLFEETFDAACQYVAGLLSGYEVFQRTEIDIDQNVAVADFDNAFDRRAEQAHLG